MIFNQLRRYGTRFICYVYSRLSKNCIIDLDFKSKQLNQVESQVLSFVARYRNSPTIATIDNTILINALKVLTIVGNTKDAKLVLNVVEQRRFNNNEERAIKIFIVIP